MDYPLKDMEKEQQEQDTSSQIRAIDAHVDVVEIRPIYDEESWLSTNDMLMIMYLLTGQQLLRQPRISLMKESCTEC
ncbi:hypothetical protein Tco_1473799 [Tanacetum coccineum]